MPSRRSSPLDANTFETCLRVASLKPMRPPARTTKWMTRLLPRHPHRVGWVRITSVWQAALPRRPNTIKMTTLCLRIRMKRWRSTRCTRWVGRTLMSNVEAARPLLVALQPLCSPSLLLQQRPADQRVLHLPVCASQARTHRRLVAYQAILRRCLPIHRTPPGTPDYSKTRRPNHAPDQAMTTTPRLTVAKRRHERKACRPFRLPNTLLAAPGGRMLGSYPPRPRSPPP